MVYKFQLKDRVGRVDKEPDYMLFTRNLEHSERGRLKRRGWENVTQTVIKGKQERLY